MSERAPIRIRLEGFRCVNCHYDLSGNAVGDRCPECGWAVNQSLRKHEFYTRDYAFRTIGSAFLAVTCSAVPFAGLYFARSAWRWHRDADECCEEEQVQDSRFWLQWSRIALAAAWLGAIVNLFITLKGVLWLARQFKLV